MGERGGGEGVHQCMSDCVHVRCFGKGGVLCIMYFPLLRIADEHSVVSCD